MVFIHIITINREVKTVTHREKNLPGKESYRDLELRDK